jgi:hypothetical protein
MNKELKFNPSCNDLGQLQIFIFFEHSLTPFGNPAQITLTLVLHPLLSTDQQVSLPKLSSLAFLKAFINTLYCIDCK